MTSRFLLGCGIAFALVLTGCAGYMSYNYVEAPMSLAGVSTSGSVAVGVHDQRSYVVSGNKGPTFVGLMRGGYGNPFDVATTSGAPMANDLRDAIGKALRQRGANPVAVDVAHTDNASAARAKVLAPKARRAVLLTLREWKSDTMYRSELQYDTTLTVFDERGNEIASSSARNVDQLGMTGMTPHEGMAKAVGVRLDGLFSDPKIAAALR